jgi:uncharacterized protein
MTVRTFFFGGAFGFALSRSGATDFDRILGMFLLLDPHLVGVIGVAVLVAGVGLWWLGRAAHAPACLARKPTRPGNLWGGMLFGAGWALTGTCPGTALAQVGEGKLTAVLTVAGVLLGAALFARFGERLEARLPDPWAMARSLGPRRAKGGQAIAGVPGASVGVQPGCDSGR